MGLLSALYIWHRGFSTIGRWKRSSMLLPQPGIVDIQVVWRERTHTTLVFALTVCYTQYLGKVVA
jgi:hypothetical protein